MKKIVILSVVSVFLALACFGGTAYAFNFRAKPAAQPVEAPSAPVAQETAVPAAQPAAEPAAPVAQEEAKPAPLTPEEVQKLALEAKVRGVLTSQEWIVYTYDRDTRKGVETDVLTFTNETVNSKNLAASDYPVSNYGLFANPDGSASWETMKTNPTNRKVKAFLRGELKGNVMTGAIFMKSDKAKPSTFIFSTINPGAIAPLPAAVEPPVAAPTKAAKGKKK